MTPRRLALLLLPLLPLAPALLVLSACGEQPSGADERRERPAAAPLGFELALVGEELTAVTGQAAERLESGMLA